MTDSRPKQTASLVILVIGACVAQGAYAAGVKTFDIGRQALTSALLEFGQQSGYSIGFAEELTAGKVAHSVRGRYTDDHAMRILLEGTGLTFRFVDDETIAVLSGDSLDNAQLGDRLGANSPDGSVEDAAQRTSDGADSPVAGGSVVADNGAANSSGRMDEVIVVGSQIMRADATESLPVTVWDTSRIDATAAVDGGDLFRSLPFAGAVSFNGVDTFFAGVNSARGDVSSINLRDLGTGNTLVLLNGRRVVPHPGVQTEGRVPAMTANMNAIPVEALERIEILRDGASAVYGADAVAGVINNVLKNDFEGIDVSAHYGLAEGSSLNELNVSLHAGGSFNASMTNLQLLATFTDRSGVHASERPFSQSSDLRPLLGDSTFADGRDFNNSTIRGAWGQFQLPMPVQQNGTLITSPSGVFHLQPASFDGCITSLSDKVCIDDSFIDEELYGDSNSVRQLIPELQRSTVILTGDHELSANSEVYGELLYYRADSKRRTGGSTPLPSTPVTIPAGNYWNPYGPVAFTDGRANPNRLPGIDAPAEGLNITMDSSFFGTTYRIADAGIRVIDVNNTSFRALGGARGQTSGWHWDSAVMYSEAETHDLTLNRVSSTLFQQSLALETPQAYNPFNGSGAEQPGSLVDGIPNPADVVAPFLIDVSRRNHTSLALADLKLSNPNLLGAGTRAVSAAIGIEARRERFWEDRDDRFNGTTTFTDIVTGETFDSDVMGSSVTADSDGSRDVLSVFGELALPLIDRSRNLPLLESLEIQIAARYEDYSDVGSTFQPRVSLSWRPMDALLVRGSYSRGVRVPNLPQINAGLTRRVLTATDWYRCRALLNKGDIASLASCGAAGQALIESSRTGSQTLEPEDYTSMSTGLVVGSARTGGLHATLDYWRIEQDGIVGLFGAENQVAVDYVLRLEGSESDLVERAGLTQNDLDVFAGSGLQPAGQVVQIRDSYVNLDRRVSSGLDMSFSYAFDQLPAGDIRFNVDATRLLSVDQSLPAAAAGINGLNEPAIAIVGAGDLIRRDARPKWKVAAHVQLQKDAWRTALTANYVSSFLDTSAINDLNSEFYAVGDWLTLGAFWEIDSSLLGDTIKTVRIGARNIFDEDPPLADETFGFNAAMHDSYGRYWYLRIGATF